MKKKIIAVILSLVIAIGASIFLGCADYRSGGSSVDSQSTINIGNNLQTNQPSPTDIEYSLERYNLIRRAYWVNGQVEKARTLPCEIEKPFGYIILFAGDSIVGKFVVDGKVSSLNSFLTPDSEYYEMNSNSYSVNRWLPDVDGSYGSNDSGIFFFDINGNYIEWNWKYLYTDIPIEIEQPVVKFDVTYNK